MRFSSAMIKQHMNKLFFYFNDLTLKNKTFN